MTESEMWCSADSLIDKHGPKAAIEAAMMADKIYARKDEAGHEAWKRITLAIRELEGGQGNGRVRPGRSRAGRNGLQRLIAILGNPDDERVPAVARASLAPLVCQLGLVNDQVLENDRRVRASARSTELCCRLMEMPGVGPGADQRDCCGSS
jgi:hypothetical protein